MSAQQEAVERYRESEAYLREEARIAALEGKRRLAGHLRRLADMAHIAMFREKAHDEPCHDLWERTYPLDAYRRVA